jgi:hypothetical protein
VLARSGKRVGDRAISLSANSGTLKIARRCPVVSHWRLVRYSASFEVHSAALVMAARPAESRDIALRRRTATPDNPCHRQSRIPLSAGSPPKPGFANHLNASRNALPSTSTSTRMSVPRRPARSGW